MSNPDLWLPRALDPMIRGASSSEFQKNLERAIGLLLATGAVLVSGAFLWWHVTRGIPSANDDNTTRIFRHVAHWLGRPFEGGPPLESDFGLSSVAIVVSLFTFIAGSALGAMKSGNIKFRHHRDDQDCPICHRKCEKDISSFHNAVIVEMYQYLIAFTVWMSALCAWFMLGTHQEIGAVAYVLLAVVSMVLLWSSLSIEFDRGVSTAELSAKCDSWTKRKNVLDRAVLGGTSVDEEYRRQRRVFWLSVGGAALLFFILSGWVIWVAYQSEIMAVSSSTAWLVAVYVPILDFSLICVPFGFSMLETKFERFMAWAILGGISLVNLVLVVSIILTFCSKSNLYAICGVFVLLLFLVLISCPLLLLSGLCGKGSWKATGESLYWNLRPHRDVRGRDRIAGLQVDEKWEKIRGHAASVVVSEDGSDSDEDSALFICCTYFDENNNCWYCVTPEPSNRGSEEWQRVEVAESDKESHIRNCKGFNARGWRGMPIGPPVHEGTAFDIALCDRSLEWAPGCWNLRQQGGGPSRVKRVFAFFGARARFQLRVQNVHARTTTDSDTPENWILRVWWGAKRMFHTSRRDPKK